MMTEGNPLEQLVPSSAPPSSATVVPTAAPSATLVRATVVHDSRRIDAVLPAGVPLAELVPGLLRRLGLLGPDIVHAHLRFVTADGAILRRETSLAAQGVRDGAVLAVQTRPESEADRRYDDVVEAVTDAVEAEVPAWSQRDSARTAVAAACSLLVVAALVLLGSDLSSAASAAVAGGAALLAIVAAAVLDRADVPSLAARAVGVVGCLLGGLAGYVGLGGATVPAAGAGDAVALGAAGAAGVVAAGAFAAATRTARIAAVVPGFVAVVALLFGGVTLAWGDGAAPATAVVLFALLGCATLLVPWLALAATPLRVVAPREDAEILADVPPVDPESVRAQILTGHWLVVALRIGAGVSMVALTPAVVASGAPGLALVAAAWCGLALGVRESVARADVGAALACSAAGLLVAVTLAAVWWPSWRPALLVVLLVGGFAVVLVGLLDAVGRTRLDRLGDGLRLLLLAAVPPLAVLAAGGLV